MPAAQSFVARLVAWLRFAAAWVTRALRTVFGEVDWRAPPWLIRSTTAGQATAQRVAARARANPRGSALIAGGALLALIGAYFAWQWYQARPQPELVTYTVAAPALTCYSCEPPGKPNPLVVIFRASVAPLEHVGKQFDARDLVRMTPLAAGRWSWADDRTLKFHPDGDWPVGTEYDVALARSGLLAPHVRLENYAFPFRAPAFEARIAGTEFHQDPIVAAGKKVVATLAFTHAVDPRELEKRVSLTLFDRITDTREDKLGETPFTVVYDKLRLNAHIHSSELRTPQKAGRLAVRIEAGVRAARGGNETHAPLEASVTVPGIYSLRVQEMSAQVARDEREEPSQVLVVTTNHSVLEADMPARVHAWRLPQKHPDRNLQRPYEDRPFPWSSQTVTRDILDASPKVKLEQIAGEREHYESHSFRHDAEPDNYLYVKVDHGLKSFGGYILELSAEQTLHVPRYARELRIAQQGSLLSMSGDKSITVMARDLEAVRVEVGRLLPRQIHHFVSQTGGSFSEPTFHNWSFDAANVTERLTKTIRLPPLAPGKANYASIALSEFLADDAADRRGVFLIKVQGWDPTRNRPTEGGEGGDWNSARYQSLVDTRLIVVTDLGLLAKKSLDGSRELFVQSLRTGEPVSGVNIDVLGRNGLPVLSATTDAQGHAHFADLKSFQREQQPVLYLARLGGDSSFLPMDERDRGLDLSRFDVGGVENRVDRGTLAAYLFSDRGLYRPGEEIRVGAIVRSQDWQRSLANVPLRLDIRDPRGINVRSESYAVGAAGLGEIRHTPGVNAAAGTYTVALSIVRTRERADLIGSVEVQVREFLPDRLRMTTRFSAESAEGWVSPDDLQARITLQNLFGTPAQNRRVTARITLSPAFPAFRAYPDHQFHDPQLARDAFTEQLADATTDPSGEAVFDLNLQRFARATYRLHIATEGFEADGGRGVSAESAQLVSHMPYLVGWKADGDLGYVSRGAERAVELIAIDPRAARTEVSGLTLVRIERRFVSTLIRQNNGTYQYESRQKEITLAQAPLVIAAGGDRLVLDSAEPGSFAYVVRNEAGQKLARIEYQVAGEANLTRTLEKNAELQIVLARNDYAAGDEIEMQLQAPYVGAGLITIERERVYAWQWFRTTTTSSTQRIRLPEGIEGNAYVSVAFVRDPGSEEIYTSPLSYGVQPFSISRDARRIPVMVEGPPLVKPGETMTLRYSTERPSRIVLFAIDEGILQVARYRTPDPLAHFFQKRALEVSTQQILDLILPEFRRNALAAAPGGDAESALGRHLNPFRRKGDAPVAYWSGILDADATVREARYTVPDHFNGTLRVMAVAVADDAIGVYEGRALVRGDFVLSPNAPTTVTPGDAFEVSVGVANNLAGSGAKAEIAVSLKVDAGLAIDGPARQVLTIAENGEAPARFRLRTLDRLGPANLEFTAASGDARARRRIDLSIRPATPYMTTLTAGNLRNTSRDVKIERALYPEHGTHEASLSLLPLTLGHGLVTYLGNYPYVCTEQLVSMAMPALVLSSRREFGYVKSLPGASLDGLIGELRLRQNDQGAYRLWPGGNEIAEFVSVYAQHFLIEAGESRRRVPADVVEQGNAWLRALAARDGRNLTEERNSAYAIYLLVRQGHVMSAEAARLHQRLKTRYKAEWEQDLAAVWLAATYRLMRQDGDALRVLNTLRFAAGGRTDDVYSDLMTRDALFLYVMARHFPERLPMLKAEVLETLVKRISDDMYHSLSAGTTLLALEAYARALPPEAVQQLAIAEILRDKRLRELTLPDSLLPRVEFSGEANALRFTSDSPLNAYYLITQSGFDRTPPTQAIRDGFEILREYTDEAGKPLTTIALGQQIDVHLRFRAIENRAFTDVALVDLLPGGFELVIPPREWIATLHQAPPPGAGDDQDRQASGSAYRGWSCEFCVARAAPSLRYADPREDRVVFYGAVNNSVQEIVYRIKATNVGSYVVPPAYGEAMYDRAVKARSVAGKIEVKR